MPEITIIRETPVVLTPRVAQMNGIFDVPPCQRSREEWRVSLDLPAEWNVGLIVGPSGSGKTTVARELFGQALISGWDWPADKAIVDGFPAAMSIKEITALLSSVGFSSPPSWVRPFHVLSNGEQFRVNMARTLAECPALAVVDEFTSVVDRTVAQIGSAAIQKTVRRRGQRFIAVACHYDIVDWLEPDWVYQPHTNNLARGRLWRRPPLELTIRRVHHSAWALFRKHHYLDTNLNKAAHCFVAFVGDKPAAFSSWLPFVSGTVQNAKREHRTVTLPDYQGVGIGNALSDFIASMWRGLGFRALSTTSAPAMIRSRNASKNWKLTRRPSISAPDAGTRTRARMQRAGKLPAGQKAEASVTMAHASNRLTCGFSYVGDPMPRTQAEKLIAKYTPAPKTR